VEVESLGESSGGRSVEARSTFTRGGVGCFALALLAACTTTRTPAVVSSAPRPDGALPAQVPPPLPTLPAPARKARRTSEPSVDVLRYPRSRAVLRGGLQAFGNFETTIQVQGQGTNNAGFDLEDVLGLEEEASTARIDFDLRLGQRHHVLASYYTLDRSASRTIDQEIEFEDSVFQIGAEIAAFMDIDIVKASYKYDVWQDRRNEFGLSLGVHTMLTEVGLSGEATINGGGGGTVQSSERARTDLPLPVVGAHFDSLVAPDLVLKVSSEFFAVELDEFGGFLFDNQIYLEWRFAENFGLGLGYNHFLVDVDLEEDAWEGELKYTYDGLLLFLSCAI